MFTVKRDVDNNSEEELKVKEQAILELGGLLADTKQAEGIVIFYSTGQKAALKFSGLHKIYFPPRTIFLSLEFKKCVWTAACFLNFEHIFCGIRWEIKLKNADYKGGFSYPNSYLIKDCS